MTKIVNIEIYKDTHALVMDCDTGLGEVVEIENIHEFDHEGRDMITLELEDGREFESYDDYQTWKEVD
tara:strand:- start:1598 stop:1801 length:204 start_codon:yes stop_codon:yes gene_type:complete